MAGLTIHCIIFFIIKALKISPSSTVSYYPRPTLQPQPHTSNSCFNSQLPHSLKLDKWTCGRVILMSTATVLKVSWGFGVLSNRDASKGLEEPGVENVLSYLFERKKS